MVKVRIDNITVANSEGKINDRFSFEIVFEAFENLDEDIEWKLIYVGSASNEKFDQQLESVLVGPIPCGVHKFVLESDAPKWDLIPQNDILGYTVVMLTSSYLNQEFCRVGYYVINEYVEEELRENPPTPPIYDKIVRKIISSDPRVTIFPIKWSNEDTTDFPSISNDKRLDTDQGFNNDALDIDDNEDDVDVDEEDDEDDDDEEEEEDDEDEDNEEDESDKSVDLDEEP